MQPQLKKRITPEEYLTLDEASDSKSEYFDGEMFAMAVASEQHVLITTNVVAEFRNQLKKRPCKVYSSDLRVKISATGLYTYPDIAILCGEPKFEAKKRRTLLNPTILVEVLSKSTEAYDRGMKFEHYRTLESLSDYLLISQNRPKIEHFSRQADGHWVLSESQGLDDAIELASISCRLALAEVYDKVEMEEGEHELLLRRIT